LKKLLIVLALLLVFVFSIYWGSMRWLKIYNHAVYFDDLPSHLEGLRILQISDLHASCQEQVEFDIWRHIVDLDFDIAVITGDIMLGLLGSHAGPILELEPHRQHLAALAARVPTFFVEGNHESRFLHQVARFMDEVGITFLHNEIHLLEINGGVIEIIGAAEYTTMRRTSFADFDALFAVPSNNFQLVLMHQPQLFDRFKDSGANLALAGHTHGGQIRLPFLPTIYAPNQGFWPRYGAGFYYHYDAVLYVSRGITTTYFPVRFWNRPEIAVFELRGR